jgi:cob(I)alamin adenosyltransferase
MGNFVIDIVCERLYNALMLYTGKGDKGDTSIFGCDQRISKSSTVTEALGVLDETNSFLGVCKVKAKTADITCPISGEQVVSVYNVIDKIQQDLFIVQAEVAGAEKTIKKSKVKEIERIVNAIEKELPPVKNFFISGGTEFSSMLDFSRTLARRAERRVVAIHEDGAVKVGEHTLAYLNRVSSLLYALARLVNLRSGITEQSPTYE